MAELPHPTTAAPPRIAVIGGGITGLAAAHHVTELLPQAELYLFEASPCLGGVLETIHRDGFLIERSADNFLTKLPVALDLCRRLGIADELLPTDDARRRAFVVRAGKLVPVPKGFYLMSPRRLGPILKSPTLTLSGKLRLLAEPFIPSLKPSPRGSGQGEASLPLPLGEGQGEGDLPDESVASFARRRFGRETFERLIQPLVAGIYTADAERLSMAATMPEFLHQERTQGHLITLFPSPFWGGVHLSQRSGTTPARRTGHFSDQSTDAATGARYNLFVAPKQGMTALVNALSNQLQPESIRLNAPITSIDKAGDNRWLLNPPLPLGEGRGEGATFDALLVALPTHAAARLLESSTPELSVELAQIEYAASAVVSLGFRRDQIAHPLNGFGFVVPQTENRRIIAASFASQKFPGRAPEDAVLIRTFIGGALQSELLDRSDDELRSLALEELRDLLQITGEPLVADLARWPRAMPQYHLGHLQRVARIEHLTARHPTLALAGNAYHGVGIPQCIASGEAAAQRIAANFTP